MIALLEARQQLDVVEYRESFVGRCEQQAPGVHVSEKLGQWCATSELTWMLFAGKSKRRGVAWSRQEGSHLKLVLLGRVTTDHS